MAKKELTLAERVKARLGEKRLAALATQPLCIARAGGMQDVMDAACAECAGRPDEVVAAAIRVLVLCGSQAKPEDQEP